MKFKTIIPAAVTLFGSFFAPVVQVSAKSESWGPQDRETFTWDSPADHVTFNSMTNNPEIGDERNFVRVKEAGTEGAHLDNVTLEIGKEYEVYVYVHNNAAANLNDSGKGIANNVRLKSNFPTKLSKGESGVVKGTISSTNASPKEVWDTAYLNADTTVYLSYVPNSATIHNAGSANGEILHADSLFGDGAKIAYDNNYWGVIPGCNEYAGYITYRIKVDQPQFWMEKEVSKDDANDYKSEIKAAPGDTLNFRITYKNTGTTEQTAVTVHDVLPDGLEYVEGSTFVVSPEATEGTYVADKLFGTDGLAIGDFLAGEEASITYKAKIVDDSAKFPCGDTEIYNNSSIVTENGTEYDKVKITVSRTSGCDGDTPTGVGETTPSELPKTGPTEIIFASIILLLIGMGVAYWFVSIRRVRKTTSAVAGGKGGDVSNSSAEFDGDIVKDGFIDKKSDK